MSGPHLCIRIWIALVLLGPVASEILEDEAMEPASGGGLAHAYQGLQRFPGDGEGTGIVSPKAIPLLVELKHGIRDLMLDALRTESSVRRARERVVAEVQRLGIPYFEDRSGGPYGQIEHLALESADGVDGIVIGVVTLSVPEACGEDSSLYVFRRADGAWRLSAALETTTYDSGPREGLKYVVDGSLVSGTIRIIAATSPSWCSSCWSSLHLEVVTLPSGEGAPELRSVGPIEFARCEGYSLERAKDGFSVRWVCDRDSEWMKCWARYRLDDTGVTRMESRVSAREQRSDR